MPQFFNNQLIVTKDELIPSWFSSDQILSNNIQRYKDKPYGIKRVGRAHKGSPMMIDFDTLPEHIKSALHDPRKTEHILEKFYRVDGEAVSFYNTFRFENGEYLDIIYQERYIVNASMIKAVIALRAARINERKTKGGSIHGTKGNAINGVGAVKSVSVTLLEDAHSFQRILKKKYNVEHSLPENERCFLDTLKKFEAEGYASIISKKHHTQNARKVTDQTLDLLKALFAGDKQKPTATEVHRRYDAFIDKYIEVINNETGELYDPSGFKKLSDATVKRYMADWASKIGTHAIRSGNRQVYMQQFKPYHSLDKPKFAGSIISIDDRQPPFKTPDGKRVWFYNGIDLGSEAFTCTVFGDTKEGIITEFYRELVRNYAGWGLCLPYELECEMSLNSSFTGTILREGAMFSKVRIEANNARGKRIERYYKSLRYGLEKDREGWLARPFALSESNQARVPVEEVPRIPYRDIVENALLDIQTWNNQPHSVHTHMSRWQVFCEMQHKDLKPINYPAILPHIGYRTHSSVNVGIIRLQHREFLLGIDGQVALGSKLINLMKLVEGKEVNIWWLDDHQGVVMKALVYIGTQLICEAVAKPTYNRATLEQGPNDELNRQIMSAYVATITSFGKRQKNSIDTVTLIDNRPALRKDFVMRGLEQNKLQDMPTGGLLTEQEEEDYEHIPAIRAPKSLKDRF